jgi:hypothetical protein
MELVSEPPPFWRLAGSTFFFVGGVALWALWQPLPFSWQVPGTVSLAGLLSCLTCWLSQGDRRATAWCAVLACNGLVHAAVLAAVTATFAIPKGRWGFAAVAGLLLVIGAIQAAVWLKRLWRSC